ncbi:Uncharacterised protein [Bordetella pertussis]|nr:Uncharacterised protein [Bordetella pertussis]
MRRRDRGDLRGRGLLGRQRRALGLQQQARVEQVERTDVGVAGLGRRRDAIVAIGARRRHEHARAHADFDIAFDFEGDQGLAHRGAADLQLLGQFALGGQAAAGGKIAGADAAGDLVGNHAVQARGGDGLEGSHGWCEAPGE